MNENSNYAFSIKDERPLRSLFLDLNSFFASVEQQEDPYIRNKPVCVVPIFSDGSSVIAASYTAKEKGIRAGVSVAHARELCPNIIFRTPNFHNYTYYHRKVIEATEHILPIKKVWSIDEFQIQLIGKEQEPKNAIQLAKKIKQSICTQVGECLTSSIGIASNSFLAKIGTELQKPNGLVVIETHQIFDKLTSLNLMDLPGINQRMKIRLGSKGIFTTEQLLTSSRKELLIAFGSIIGERWWYLLRGYDLTYPLSNRKSLGHSHVLPPQFRHEQGAREVALRLIEKATTRLRSEKLWAQWMHVRVRGYKKTWVDKIKFPATQDFNKFIEYFMHLWEKRDFQDPRSVGIAFYDFLKQECVTPSLFDPLIDRMQLNTIIDTINLKFGKHTIHLAGINKAKNTAQEKIAFQKTELFYEGFERISQ